MLDVRAVAMPFVDGVGTASEAAVGGGGMDDE